MIGANLDKYEVLQKIGEGGMASVYRGRHGTLRRDVAIKVLHPHLSSSPRNRRRFAREARAIESLRHENILEIYDYSGLDTDDCYIVTEFVDGTTLTDVLEQRGRLPSEITSMIGVHLLDALAYAHRAGVLHRDLKPDNVMVRSDGVVKLMDFGIARFLDESQLTLTGALVGSPAYMSPEQAREEPLDARSDLFSFGTLLFHLVAGVLPFSGSNPSVVLKNIIEGRHAQLAEVAPDMSAVLADTIERLLSPRPEDRYATAEDAAAELRLSLAEVGIADEGDTSIRAWLADAEAWNERVRGRLRDTLLHEGRRRMADGDAVGALRLLNRLLSMEPDHPEVIAAVQGLHQPAAAPAADRRGPRWPWLAGVTLAAAGAALALASFTPQAAPETTAPVTPATPVRAVEAPAPPPPDPTPVVAADPEKSPEPPPEPATPADAARRAPPVASAPAASSTPAVVPEDPAPAPAPPPTPRQDEPARVEIRANLAADIWLGDRRVGSTRQRDPIEVPPGVHEFELRSEMVEPRVVRVIVAPGEHWAGPTVVLEHRPATVHLVDFDPACVVTVDGLARGTVGELGQQLALRAPTTAHDLTVTCPDARPFHHRTPSLTTPDYTVRRAP